MCLSRKFLFLKKICALAGVCLCCFSCAAVVLSDDEKAADHSIENMESLDPAWEGIWSGTKLNSYEEEEDVILTVVKESKWKIKAEVFKEKRGEWQWIFEGAQLSGYCIVEQDDPSGKDKGTWLIRKLFLTIHENHLRGWCGETIKKFSDLPTAQEMADINIKEKQDILMDRMP